MSIRKKVTFCAIGLLICCTGLFTYSQQHQRIVTEDLLDDIHNGVTVEEKVLSASRLFGLSQSKEEKIDIIKTVSQQRRNDLDREQLANYLKSVANQETNIHVKVRALKEAGVVMRYDFRYPESREYFDQAYAIYPETTLEEKSQKGKLYYEIVEDDWYAGRWEKGYQGFCDFAALYADANVKNHQMYAFFEAIPTLVLKIQEHVPDSKAIQQFLKQAESSDNSGELFAAAMTLFTVGEYDLAMKAADNAVEASKDSRWPLYRSFLKASISFLQENTDECLNELNQLVATNENDYHIAYFVRIFGMMIPVYWYEEYSKSYPLYDWFLQSTLVKDDERFQSLPKSIVAHIRTSYAIDLMYFDRMDDSLESLKDVFYQYFGSDEGNFAGLVVSEHYMNNGNIDRAENILSMIFETSEFDRDTAPRANLVMSLLKKKQNKMDEANQFLQRVENLPERIGDIDITRAKFDALNQ
jgi:tetratricopeptide (TPR) repeat protein